MPSLTGKRTSAQICSDLTREQSITSAPVSACPPASKRNKRLLNQSLISHQGTAEAPEFIQDQIPAFKSKAPAQGSLLDLAKQPSEGDSVVLLARPAPTGENSNGSAGDVLNLHDSLSSHASCGSHSLATTKRSQPGGLAHF